MPTLKQVVHTLVSRFLLVLMLAVLGLPLLIFICLPNRWRIDNPVYYWFLNIFYKASLAITLLPIRYRGKEHIPDNAAVIVANHQSTLDIPIVGVLLKRHAHVWLAKKELLESPAFWFWLPRTTVLIDMSTPMKGLRSLTTAISMVLNHHRHAVIFPEGTRYTDGDVHEFYAGFVILAKKTGRPVIPVRIFGVNKAYPPETFWIHYYPLTVVIGEPMYIQENETDEAFKDRVHAWFLKQHEEA